MKDFGGVFFFSSILDHFSIYCPFCYCLDQVALYHPAFLRTVEELLSHLWCLPHANDRQQINAYYFLVKHKN